jgi:hypothetical protein
MWFMASLLAFVIIEIIALGWYYGRKAMKNEEIRAAIEDGFAQAAEIAAKKAVEKINKR